MFVSGLPFLITLSRRVRYVTIQFVLRRTAGELANAMKMVVGLYRRAGIICQTALMDGEFEKIKQKIINIIEVNITSKNEHVPEIERKIRHIKERVRSMKADLPYQVLPNIMIKRMVLHAGLLLNAYVDKQGISNEYSPREIILRWQLRWDKHCKHQFGAYGQAYDDPSSTKTNTQQARSRDVLCLGPTGNIQGSYYFVDLSTKAVIKRRRIQELPVPDSIIKKVEAWGRRDKQTGIIRFGNRNNDPYEWDNGHEALVEDNAPEPEEAPFPDIPAETPGVEIEANVPALVTPPPPPEEQRLAAAVANAGIDGEFKEFRFRGNQGDGDRRRDERIVINHNQFNVIPAEHDEIEAGDDEVDDEDDMPGLEVESAASESDDETYVDEELEDVDLEYDEDELEAQEEGDENEGESTGLQETRSGRRVRPPARYRDTINITVGGMHFTVGQMHFPFAAMDLVTPIPVYKDELQVLGVIMVQLSLKEGLKRFGKRGKQGALKEMRQLHDMRTFFPGDPKTLTREEQRKALSSLIFLKEKDSGEVKGRACINGAPQREYIRKEDAASPTVATDSVFLTGAVDAYQRRDVAYIDLPGAFLHTLTDEKVIMVLRRELCELMCLVEPKLYRKYVCKDKRGQPVLYVELYKSLYGLMRSALLFYRKLRKELEEYGMEMNPYDMCVANKDTKHGQLTILWHVDDLKLSCRSKVEVTKLICYLRNIYGDKMTIERGGKRKYLGMNLDFTEPGVLQVDMSHYVKEILTDFPEKIEKTSPTPHSDSLFTVKEEDEAKLLPEEPAIQFHRTTAQLLFLSTRARKDIQTAISFLTTRVKKPAKTTGEKFERY
eukprot:CCRYP_015076-RE/>CCRYP_015076-RE protein AED:0.49 eAED:0.25 QI:0/-1/0/1/-1/1/1/0/834